MKILVGDNISKEGIKKLEDDKAVEFDVKTGLSEDELAEVIGEYDGIIIRSGVKITAKVLAKSGKLKVVGRAGVGVDNVDIDEATKKGVIVMNTPDGNTIAATEHTIAMILSLSRRIPEAYCSMKGGRWDRKMFVGNEVNGKTLGVIGFGRIGRGVAERMTAFGMRILVFDPFVKKDSVNDDNIEVVEDVSEIFKRADYITIHVPKTKETADLISMKELKMMKPTTRIVNVARGGIVNEDDLAKALDEGIIAGAAIDVFSEEPTPNKKLVDAKNIVVTPHLGASTVEAQENVALQVIDQMLEYLKEGVIKNAVNFKIKGDMAKIAPYMLLAEKIGKLHTQLIDEISTVKITLFGEIAESIDVLCLAVQKGILEPICEKGSVNLVNAPFLMKEKGIKIEEIKSSEDNNYHNLIKVEVIDGNKSKVISGSVFGKDLLRITRIDEFFMDIDPNGHFLVIGNTDKPGVIGDVGSLLGKKGVNIANWVLGRMKKGGDALAIVAVDDILDDDIINDVEKINNVVYVKQVEL